MGDAVHQAGQNYRQQSSGEQPRHRACAYRARPSCTHLVRHALAHKMLAHVGVCVSGVRRKPCTERLIFFRSIHCAALVSRDLHTEASSGREEPPSANTPQQVPGPRTDTLIIVTKDTEYSCTACCTAGTHACHNTAFFTLQRAAAVRVQAERPYMYSTSQARGPGGDAVSFPLRCALPRPPA